MDARNNPSLSASFPKTSGFWNQGVSRIGPRTIFRRESRQVRKEAAAADARCVTEKSDPVGAYLYL